MIESRWLFVIISMIAGNSIELKSDIETKIDSISFKMAWQLIKRRVEGH